jgi:hypothetical protein
MSPVDARGLDLDRPGVVDDLRPWIAESGLVPDTGGIFEAGVDDRDRIAPQAETLSGIEGTQAIAARLHRPGHGSRDSDNHGGA